MFLRYGKIDPAQKDIENGSGQHVGTVDEIARRLQSALYYIGSRWPDAPRSHDEESLVDPADGAETCEVVGACDWAFTDSRGRKGPVSVNLPPGYAHKDLQNKRYPVIFLLHGYGQTPEDLKAAIAKARPLIAAFQDHIVTDPVGGVGIGAPSARSRP